MLLALGAAAACTWPGWLRNVPGGLPVNRSFAATGRQVWLTIDDGPARRDTEGMLEALDSHSARATFFPIGSCAAKHPHLLRRIVEAGHSIGNHTFAHRSGSFWAESLRVVRADLQKSQLILSEILGEAPQWYRAPAGRWSRQQARAAGELDLACCGWSIAGGDGMCMGDLWRAMNRIVEGLVPGAIIVIHQGGRRGRVEALKYLLHRLEQEGWMTTLPSRESLRISLP